MPAREETVPGLKPGLSVRAAVYRGSEAASLFLYLRLVSPGSQGRYQGIRGKCWIDPGSPGPGLPGLPGPQMVNNSHLLTRIRTLLTRIRTLK